MADMITLYTPEPPSEPHKCETGMYVSFDAPRVLQGAVIGCKTCGQLWYAERDDMAGTDKDIYTIYWRKVRWYHFDLKKKARENG